MNRSIVLVLMLAACETPAATNDAAASDAAASDAPRADAATPGVDAFRDDGGPRDAGRPPVQVGACDALGAVGTWQNVTPPAIPAGATVFALAVDPVNAGTVYLGTIHEGIWKTTDCGAHWTHIDTGRNAAVLDAGMNWTFVVDPVEPNIVYTNAGYGAGSNGLFRSTNGGVDWDPIWPPADPALSSAFNYNFANTVAMDPHDRRHLLLSFHEACLPPHRHVCIAETMDAGASWHLLDGDARWTTDGEGVRVDFLDDDRTWMWSSQVDGLWRTSDGGASWAQLTTQGANHLQATQMMRALDGTFVLAGMGDLWTSPRGTSAGAWTSVEGSGPLPGGVVSDGTHIYTSNCYYVGFCEVGSTRPFYFRASESDPTSWSTLPFAPPAEMHHTGGVLGYDRAHHVLYSSNLDRGFWRIVTE